MHLSHVAGKRSDPTFSSIATTSMPEWRECQSTSVSPLAPSSKKNPDGSQTLSSVAFEKSKSFGSWKKNDAVLLISKKRYHFEFTSLPRDSMFTAAAFVLTVCFLIYAYRRMKPPPPKISGTATGPPVTSPRIKLSDGRYLAYKESGVLKENATFKLILVHGFDSSKDLYLPLSQDFMDELGLYVVTYDRAGYGESDPYPKRSLKSEAFDIQELADQLQLGPKFHIIGLSISTYAVWACLKYIPHRLAGATLVAPVINFWWPSFPPKLANDIFQKQLKRDQWKLRIAHYVPGLLYWWMTQKWFPHDSVTERHPILFNKRDVETIKLMSKVPMPNEYKIRQQGEYESLYRDMMVHFGNWEFDPMELTSPFPQNEGGVYLWQGHEDKLVPFELQRYLAKQLSWIRYHEVPDGGHLMIHEKCLCENIFRELLLGEEPTFN